MPRSRETSMSWAARRAAKYRFQGTVTSTISQVSATATAAMVSSVTAGTRITRAAQATSNVTEAPASVTRCSCSLCAKRGALWAYYTPAQFRLTTPEAKVATYRWGSRTVKHHFCANCGCGTYSESPDWSTGKPDFENPRVGVNSRLLNDFDLDAIEVTVIDGKNLW